MPLPRNHVRSALTSPHARWDVLAFIGSLDIGGCERHLATVYPRLASAGFRVGIVTFRGGGPLESQVRAGGVDVLCLDRQRKRWSLRLFGRQVGGAAFDLLEIGIRIWDIAHLLRSRRVGVAHFYLPGAYILGGLGALLAGFGDTVMSRRSLNNYQKTRPIAARIERFLHAGMRLLVANSRPVLAELEAEGAPSGRTLLLYSGVDLDVVARAPGRVAARQKFDVSDDTLIMAIVANLIPYKGHADLIEALGRIATSLERPWLLLVAGRDDGIGAALQRRATGLGIAENIRWLGAIDDVPALWRAADIGVLASHEEGLPNSLMEGMAFGVPMVATTVGGVNDIATDGVDALLIPPRDAEALGRALLRLIEDPMLRARVGRAAAARIADSFPLTRCIDAYGRLYKLMLRQPKLSSEDIVHEFAAQSTATMSRPRLAS